MNISLFSKKYYIFAINNKEKNGLHTECMGLV